MMMMKYFIEGERMIDRVVESNRNIYNSQTHAHTPTNLSSIK